MNSATSLQSLKHSTLLHFWGHHSFRPLQSEAIDSLLEGSDTTVLLPTGAGKSLCYQLPALLLEGTALVVSPLIALMRDQVQQLRSMGIEAELLISSMEDHEMETVLGLCREGVTRLLFVAPERLSSRKFRTQMEDIPISFIAVDEAHCISEWGQDFRPNYRHIKTFREQVKPVPIIALTATATPSVLFEIKERLGLSKPRSFSQSFRRENLSLFFEQTLEPFERVYQLLSGARQSALVYCRTRKQTELLTQMLLNKGLGNVDYYHAGLSSGLRTKKQKQWLESPARILVATNAFGMGIDKQDLHTVIHLSPPQSIENYYQEVGRAGRDGKPSFAFLLYSQPALTTMDSLLERSIASRVEFQKITSLLYSLCQIADGERPERTYYMPTEKIERLSGCHPQKIRGVVEFLHNQELLFLKDYPGPSTLQIHMAAEEIDDLAPSQSAFLEALTRALPGVLSFPIPFQAKALSEKLQTSWEQIKVKLEELSTQQLLTYTDGERSTLRFLTPRSARDLEGKFYQLYERIQQSKVRKWEEMKHFVLENTRCKMEMILAYFKESSPTRCGQCSVCRRDRSALEGSSAESDILSALSEGPATLEMLSTAFPFHARSELQQRLIYLLDEGLVRMVNFKTYALA